MPNDLNPNGHFEPIHDAHAIEQVMFSLQFEQALDESAFVKLQEAAGQFEGDLPGRTNLQGVSFAIGAGGPLGQVSSMPAVAIALSRTAPDGTVESELRIDRTALAFRTTQYTRWESVWSRAEAFFVPLVKEFLGTTRISAIGLNYVDRFVWTGKIVECNPALLLREKSSYICPHVYLAKDLWHSHTGVFLRPDSFTKRLLNVNVDYLDENRPDGQRRSVAIKTVLTDQLNQPGYESKEITAADSMVFIGSSMQELHDFGKSVFGNIINDTMCNRIALEN